MADSVNAQVVDSVTTANVKVLGDAPAVAVGTVMSVLSQTVSLSMENASAQQIGLTNVGIAITTMGATLISKLATQ